MFDLIKPLVVRNASKIVLAVADGLGGLPVEPGGPTELEAAATPNLDALVSGRRLRAVAAGPAGHHARQRARPSRPVRLRPARAPDRPRRARGARHRLRAASRRLAARGNFCTVDADGRITDRRAGRIADEPARAIVARLKQIRVPGASCSSSTSASTASSWSCAATRAGAEVADTDPGRDGVRPLAPRALNPESEPTARLLEQFITQAAAPLKDEPRPTW